MDPWPIDSFNDRGLFCSLCNALQGGGFLNSFGVKRSCRRFYKKTLQELRMLSHVALYWRMAIMLRLLFSSGKNVMSVHKAVLQLSLFLLSYNITEFLPTTLSGSWWYHRLEWFFHNWLLLAGKLFLASHYRDFKVPSQNNSNCTSNFNTITITITHIQQNIQFQHPRQVFNQTAVILLHMKQKLVFVR